MQRLASSLGRIAVVMVAATGAFAQDVDCNDPQTQTDMNICASERYKEADAELNAAWKRAFAAMKGADAASGTSENGAADALLAAQRLWIPYRDKACEAEGWLFHGGTMEPLIIYSCLEEITRYRTARLKLIAEAF